MNCAILDVHLYSYITILLLCCVQSELVCCLWVHFLEFGWHSWVSRNYAGIFVLAGVFAGSLCDTFGCRAVAMLGNAIATIGMISAAFASNFVLLFISYGIVTGNHLYDKMQ